MGYRINVILNIINILKNVDMICMNIINIPFSLLVLMACLSTYFYKYCFVVHNKKTFLFFYDFKNTFDKFWNKNRFLKICYENSVIYENTFKIILRCFCWLSSTTVFENYSLIFYKIKVYLGIWNIFIIFFYVFKCILENNFYT